MFMRMYQKRNVVHTEEMISDKKRMCKYINNNYTNDTKSEQVNIGE